MSDNPTSIDELITEMRSLDASDLHLTAGRAADGALPRRAEAASRLRRARRRDDARALIYGILSTEQHKVLETRRSIDMAYSVPGVARLRVNAFFQREMLGAALRIIPSEIRSLHELGFPAHVERLAQPGARARPRHGADRIGQVDDARGARRPHQLDAPRAHPHDRGPDRVPARPPRLHRQPARDRLRRDVVRRGPPRRAASGPRRHPRRRDARPRDDRAPRSPRQRRATSCSRRSTPRARRRRSTASSTSSRPSSRTRCASSSPARCRASSARRSSRRPTAGPGRRRSRSCFPTTRCGTSSARGRSSRSTRSCRPERNRGMQTMEQSLADLWLRGVITRELALARTTQARAAAGPGRPRRHPGRCRRSASRTPTGGGLDDGHAQGDQALRPRAVGAARRSPRERPQPPVERRRVVPKEIVGLKIDSAELSAAHVVNEGDKRLAQGRAQRRSPSGIVSGGEVRDPAALGGALERSSSPPTPCPGAASSSVSATAGSACASSRWPTIGDSSSSRT